MSGAGSNSPLATTKSHSEECEELIDGANLNLWTQMKIFEIHEETYQIIRDTHSLRSEADTRLLEKDLVKTRAHLATLQEADRSDEARLQSLTREFERRWVRPGTRVITAPAPAVQSFKTEVDYYVQRIVTREVERKAWSLRQELIENRIRAQVRGLQRDRGLLQELLQEP